MRIICGSVFVAMLLFNFNVRSDGNNAGSGDSFEPAVVSNVSDAAIEDSVSFGGMRYFLGLGLLRQTYDMSVGGRSETTSVDMNMITISPGLGYGKTFGSNLFVSVDASMDLSRKKTKSSGDWKSINAAFAALHGALPNTSAKLTTNIITPKLQLRFGSVVPKWKSIVFAEVGASRVGGTCSYFSSGLKSAESKINAIVPDFGIGMERKINKALSLSLGAAMSIKKTVKTMIGNTEHRVKVGGINVKVIIVYSPQWNHSGNSPQMP